MSAHGHARVARRASPNRPARSRDPFCIAAVDAVLDAYRHLTAAGFPCDDLLDLALALHTAPRPRPSPAAPAARHRGR